MNKRYFVSLKRSKKRSRVYNYTEEKQAAIKWMGNCLNLPDLSICEGLSASGILLLNLLNLVSPTRVLRMETTNDRGEQITNNLKEWYNTLEFVFNCPRSYLFDLKDIVETPSTAPELLVHSLIFLSNKYKSIKTLPCAQDKARTFFIVVEDLDPQDEMTKLILENELKNKNRPIEIKNTNWFDPKLKISPSSSSNENSNSSFDSDSDSNSDSNSDSSSSGASSVNTSEDGKTESDEESDILKGGELEISKNELLKDLDKQTQRSNETEQSKKRKRKRRRRRRRRRRRKKKRKGTNMIERENGNEQCRQSPNKINDNFQEIEETLDDLWGAAPVNYLSNNSPSIGDLLGQLGNLSSDESSDLGPIEDTYSNLWSTNYTSPFHKTKLNHTDTESSEEIDLGEIAIGNLKTVDLGPQEKEILNSKIGNNGSFSNYGDLDMIENQDANQSTQFLNQDISQIIILPSSSESNDESNVSSYGENEEDKGDRDQGKTKKKRKKGNTQIEKENESKDGNANNKKKRKKIKKNKKK